MKDELINVQLEKLVHHLESFRIAAYMDLLERPVKLILINFISGLAKGLGIAIGATVVFAALLSVLQSLIVLNLPVIGDFIAEIVHIVELKNGKF